ncbi:hypothetical protein [Streptomyces sp. NPDC057582]|uniref:hypothetical protein n=1 Tax=Streptomyces sp. NPDC057582 TaxID=3346174 RepID=UPI003687FE70
MAAVGRVGTGVPVAERAAGVTIAGLGAQRQCGDRHPDLGRVKDAVTLLQQRMPVEPLWTGTLADEPPF